MKRGQYTSLEEKLMDNIAYVPEAGCWLWEGPSRSTMGHGGVYIGKQGEAAHRLSWRIHRGPIPEGMFVCHKCDTPPCVNPDHLFIGTQLDNMRDCIAKQRNRWAGHTHCPQGHELTGDNAPRWGGRRVCRTCQNNASRNYMRRRRAQEAA